jgi:alkylated DNA nucleotide flippase Atl1
MQVQETTLANLLQGQKQFRVPLFQRQYRWSNEDRGQLWSDILDQYQIFQGGEGHSHFIGSFVLSPVPAPASTDVAAFLVVDGQQRITTLTLALCAIRDTAVEADPTAADKYNELYLVNKWQGGSDRYRVVPTQKDRSAYFACVDATTGTGGSDAIGEAYRYFRAAIKQGDRDRQPFDLDSLTSVLTRRLAIVDITTGADDNPHRIFESLNATGVSLTQGDLLRNYLFMRLPTQGEYLYDHEWQPMEERLGAEHLEGLARVDLQRRGQDVTKDDVYRRQQQRLDAEATHEAAVESQLKDLVKRADQYVRIIKPEAEPDADLRAQFAFLRDWGAQTTHPLLMYLLDLQARKLCSVETVREAVTYVQSFLVRRQLASIPTNQLNRLFVQLIPSLPADDRVATKVREELSGERRYWPTDTQILEAAKSRPFYFQGRGNQRKLILEALELSFEHVELLALRTESLTIEHILPQTLSPEWREHLESMGQDPDETRDRLVHTLGNLTLSGYNGQLSNSPFERKREIYEHSHLEMNLALQGDSWGADEILARSIELAQQACKIWPAPLPGVGSSPQVSAFDWSTIDIAVSAIPAGGWTSYGDLAELSGTSAVAVGQRMASAVGGSNAYRVLSSDGRISPGFHWSDPDDQRDIRTVLEEDGVRFDDVGVADQSQRLRAADLLSLVPDTDDGIELDPGAIT